MNQLKEVLIWIVLGIPGMVLIGLVLHSLVHFETGVLVITSMILVLADLVFVRWKLCLNTLVRVCR